MLTVVTGGSRGIGAAICRRLAADGHDIVLGYQSSTERAEETAAAVREAGARCELVQMDTASAADVDRLFDAAGALGQVTGLVNNAGIVGPNGRLVEIAVDELARVYEVNVVGVLLCARRAVLDGVGAIVNISSAPRRSGPRASTSTTRAPRPRSTRSRSASPRSSPRSASTRSPRHDLDRDPRRP